MHNWKVGLAASFNVAPTQQIPAIRAMEGMLQGLTLRWGLIPFFAKGEPPKYSTINATIEKVETGPIWRGPWKRGQRCLIPALGFYEWNLDDAGEKHPFYIHAADQDIFAFAGLWDASAKADGTPIESCAIITMPANELMRNVHNTGNNPHRMPAILARDDQDVWLRGTLEQAKAVLKPYPAEVMVAYQVSRRVNTPKNNDDKLIMSVEPDAS